MAVGYAFGILVTINSATSFLSLADVHLYYIFIGIALILLSISFFISRVLIFDIKTFIFVFLASYLYFNISDGYFFVINIIFVYTLFFYWIGIGNIYQALKRILIFLFFLSFLSYLGYLVGFTVPNFILIGDREMFLHGFMLTDFPALDVFQPGSLRFYGFSNEPGAAAALILLILVNEDLKIRGNIPLIILGLATFSTAFFGIILIYFFYYNRKKILVLFPVFIVVLFFISFFKYGLVIEFFKTKLFYIFSNDFDYKTRLDSSFFHIFDKTKMLGFMYIISILLLPRKFWFLFFALAFFRVHFIFNMVPLIAFLSYLHRLSIIQKLDRNFLLDNPWARSNLSKRAMSDLC